MSIRTLFPPLRSARAVMALLLILSLAILLLAEATKHAMAVIPEDPPVTHDLTVQSSPFSSVSITVIPADNSGLSNGSTQFARTYNEGTQVTLTAPTTVGDYTFNGWKVDSIPISGNPIQVQMTDDRIAEATYTPILRTLAVSSTPSTGVTITVSPTDTNGQSDGVTNFTRVYNQGTFVNLTAPTVANQTFSNWEVDGNYTVGNPIQVEMPYFRSAVATYSWVQRGLTIRTLPTTGLTVTASPPDSNGNSSGSTDFTLVYDHGSVVTLTAPPPEPNQVFVEWRVDGTPVAGDPIQIDMTANHTAIALYNYTSATVPSEVSDLQEALNYTVPGGTVTVEPGLYMGGFTLSRDLILTSTDPASPDVVAATILDGSWGGTVLSISPTVTSACTVQGFNISWAFGEAGGGAIHGNGSQATLCHNIFEYNTADAPEYGGAITDCDGLIEDNIFRNNIGTGAGAMVGCGGTIRQNLIENNTGRFAGALNQCQNVQANLIVNNSAIGFASGIHGYGGGLYECGGVISNNIIAWNTAAHSGGGLSTCDAEIVNNTIWGNTAGVYGGGIADSPGAEIQNCILWNNQAPTLPQLSSAPANVEYSCVEGWGPPDAQGNFEDAPQFLFPEIGNFHIPALSPCVNTGVALLSTVDDFEGDSRDAQQDVGADEFTGQTWPDSPAALAIEHIGADFVVSWTAMDDVAGFNIYLATDPDGPFVPQNGEGLATPASVEGRMEFTLPSPEPPPVFYVAVTAVNLGPANGTALVPLPSRFESSPTVIEGENVHSLLVQSNPDVDVLAEVTPSDNSGLGSGTTEILFTYDHGDLVTLSVPASCPSAAFVRWMIDGAPAPGIPDGQTDILLTMDQNHTAVAIYEIFERTLTLNSAPSDGVLISVSPLDKVGNGDGATPMTRVYDHGTLVSLTAPAPSSVEEFVGWSLDEAPVSGNPISVEMLSDHTAEAVYEPVPRLLTVQSIPSSLPIFVSPLDRFGAGSASTEFIRTYDHGATVTLTAPTPGSTEEFIGWEVDSVAVVGNPISIEMLSDHIAEAAYGPAGRTLTVASSPESHEVTITPPDRFGLSDGTTPLTRVYDHGTSAILFAGDPASHEAFAGWLLDGVAAGASTELSLEVSLTADHQATALYETATRTLLVRSLPNQGVAITVSPEDEAGLTTCTTDEVRHYLHGTSVTLEAPATAYYQDFAGWLVDGEHVAGNPITISMVQDREVIATYYSSFITVTPGQMTIQQAIDMALPLANITIEPGIYEENITYRGKRITLRSTDHLDPAIVAQTIIAGVRDDLPVVTFEGTETDPCQLIGLTITGGRNVTGTGPHMGGGICGGPPAGPWAAARIEYCVIEDNEAEFGGGIANLDGYLEHCIIRNNVADTGGGIYQFSGATWDNTIEFNQAIDGGGMAMCTGIGVSPVVTGVTVMVIPGDPELGEPGIFGGNIISQNTATNRGGGLFDCGGAWDCGIQNNIISFNQAAHGGGIWGCRGGIVNNTIWGNQASSTGGGIWSDGSTSAISNNIIWANAAVTDEQIHSDSVSPGPTPEHNAIEDWPDGDTNISPEDPGVVSPSSQNFHLLPTSECIDEGTPFSFVVVDQDGRSRDYTPPLDLGAFEYTTDTPPIPSPPTSLTINADFSDHVLLTWTHNPIVDGYVIYASTVGPEGPFGPASFPRDFHDASWGTTDVRVNVKPGPRYYWAIAAVNTDNVNFSESEVFTPPDNEGTPFRTIVLDPGHGWTNSGAVPGMGETDSYAGELFSIHPYEEVLNRDLVYRIGLALDALIAAPNTRIRWMPTRDLDNQGVQLFRFNAVGDRMRARFAYHQNAVRFLSIHLNADDSCSENPPYEHLADYSQYYVYHQCQPDEDFPDVPGTPRTYEYWHDQLCFDDDRDLATEIRSKVETASGPSMNLLIETERSHYAVIRDSELFADDRPFLWESNMATWAADLSLSMELHACPTELNYVGMDHSPCLGILWEVNFITSEWFYRNWIEGGTPGTPEWERYPNPTNEAWRDQVADKVAASLVRTILHPDWNAD